jgi:hypothetical protein
MASGKKLRVKKQLISAAHCGRLTLAHGMSEGQNLNDLDSKLAGHDKSAAQAIHSLHSVRSSCWRRKLEKSNVINHG